MQKINFYTLSTGRCGTKMLYYLLNIANNADIEWQPHPLDINRLSKELITEYIYDKNLFLENNINDYPDFKKRIDKRFSFPYIYGDTSNHMCALGYILYKHMGNHLRLIHLIRHPVTCCKSILAAERDDSGHGRFKELRAEILLENLNTSAEKAANVWVKINECIGFQFHQINSGNDSICKVLHLEDFSVEKIKSIFRFLHLTGFSGNQINSILEDKTKRHSHINSPPDGIKRPAVTTKELEIIWEICSPLAKEYGYYESNIDQLTSNISK